MKHHHRLTHVGIQMERVCTKAVERWDQIWKWSLRRSKQLWLDTKHILERFRRIDNGDMTSGTRIMCRVLEISRDAELADWEERQYPIVSSAHTNERSTYIGASIHWSPLLNVSVRGTMNIWIVNAQVEIRQRLYPSRTNVWVKIGISIDRRRNDAVIDSRKVKKGFTHTPTRIDLSLKETGSRINENIHQQRRKGYKRRNEENASEITPAEIESTPVDN